MGSLLQLGLLLGCAGGWPDLAPAGGDPAAPCAERVRILTDFDEPRLIERLRGLLEGALPVFERATGHRLPEGEYLILNLYGSLRGYQRGARSAGVSGFMNVGAVTAWSNQESFLAVQPRSDPVYLEAAGWLPDLTAQLALHEVAHQFMARAGMYPTLALPPWYSEGVADHLAALALRELLYGSAGRCLMLDDARHSVAQAAAQARTIPLRELFTVTATDLDAHAARDLFYDQSAALVDFLVGSGNERWGATFQRYLDELERQEQALSTLEFLDRRAGNRDRWLDLVADLPALEQDWRDALESTDTPWIERQGSAQWIGDDLLTAALAWQDSGYVESSAPGPTEPRSFRCEFDLLDLEGGEAFVVLHAPAGKEGGLKLTLSREGRVALVGWRGTDSSVVAAEAPTLRAERGFVSLRLEIDGARVVVHIADDASVELCAPGGYPTPGGTWGLGAWRDAVLWRGVRFE